MKPTRNSWNCLSFVFQCQFSYYGKIKSLAKLCAICEGQSEIRDLCMRFMPYLNLEHLIRLCNRSFQVASIRMLAKLSNSSPCALMRSIHFSKSSRRVFLLRSNCTPIHRRFRCVTRHVQRTATNYNTLLHDAIDCITSVLVALRLVRLFPRSSNGKKN